jgi:hypothetical protein
VALVDKLGLPAIQLEGLGGIQEPDDETQNATQRKNAIE